MENDKFHVDLINEIRYEHLRPLSTKQSNASEVQCFQTIISIHFSLKRSGRSINSNLTRWFMKSKQSIRILR